MGAAVGAAVVDATKGPVPPAVVATAGSLGGLLVVAGAGAAVLAALVESGAAGLEGRAAACSVVETGGTVGAGVAVVMAAGERGASSCLAVVGGGVGSFVCPAPSLARVAVVADAAASPPVGATVVLPATGWVVPAFPGDTVVVDGLDEASFDTGLAEGSPAAEHTLSSRTPGGQHKSHFWVSSQ